VADLRGRADSVDRAGRAVNRSADNPLQIDVLTKVVLPIEVDEATTWDEIQPSLAQVMKARGAVPVNYRDMAAAYPDLFESGEAARKALSRGNPGQTPVEQYLISVCPGVFVDGLSPHRFTRTCVDPALRSGGHQRSRGLDDSAGREGGRD